MPPPLGITSSTAIVASRCIRGIQIGGRGSGAAAPIRFLIARPLQNDHGLPIAQIRLIHENGLAKLVLQHLTHNVEVGGGLPAGLQLAAAGHSMALAAELHVVGNGL